MRVRPALTSTTLDKHDSAPLISLLLFFIFIWNKHYILYEFCMNNRAFLSDLDVFLDTISTLDKLDVAFFYCILLLFLNVFYFMLTVSCKRHF